MKQNLVVLFLISLTTIVISKGESTSYVYDEKDLESAGEDDDPVLLPTTSFSWVDEYLYEKGIRVDYLPNMTFSLHLSPERMNQTLLSIVYPDIFTWMSKEAASQKLARYDAYITSDLVSLYSIYLTDLFYPNVRDDLDNLAWEANMTTIEWMRESSLRNSNMTILKETESEIVIRQESDELEFDIVAKMMELIGEEMLKEGRNEIVNRIRIMAEYLIKLEMFHVAMQLKRKEFIGEHSFSKRLFRETDENDEEEIKKIMDNLMDSKGNGKIEEDDEIELLRKKRQNYNGQNSNDRQQGDSQNNSGQPQNENSSNNPQQNGQSRNGNQGNSGQSNQGFIGNQREQPQNPNQNLRQPQNNQGENYPRNGGQGGFGLPQSNPQNGNQRVFGQPQNSPQNGGQGGFGLPHSNPQNGGQGGFGQPQNGRQGGFGQPQNPNQNHGNFQQQSQTQFQSGSGRQSQNQQGIQSQGQQNQSQRQSQFQSQNQGGSPGREFPEDDWLSLLRPRAHDSHADRFSNRNHNPFHRHGHFHSPYYNFGRHGFRPHMLKVGGGFQASLQMRELISKLVKLFKIEGNEYLGSPEKENELKALFLTYMYKVYDEVE